MSKVSKVSKVESCLNRESKVSKKEGGKEQKKERKWVWLSKVSKIESCAVNELM